MNRLFATSFSAGRLAITAGVALFFFCAIPAVRAGESTAPTPAPVTLVLQWNHQAQFAGYYMALEKGLYLREGLDVRIRRGGPDVLPCEELGAGRADFCCTMLSTALEKRAAGVPLVLLAQIVSRSNFVLVAWKHPPGEPGATISRPADLTGRRVTVWEADSPDALPRLLRRGGRQARDPAAVLHSLSLPPSRRRRLLGDAVQ